MRTMHPLQRIVFATAPALPSCAKPAPCANVNYHLRAGTNYVTAAGVTYAYRKPGGGRNIPVVMPAPTGGATDDRAPAITNSLARHPRVILFDRAGTGAGTGHPPDNVAAMVTGAALRQLQRPVRLAGSAENALIPMDNVRHMRAYWSVHNRSTSGSRPCGGVPAIGGPYAHGQRIFRTIKKVTIFKASYIRHFSGRYGPAGSYWEPARTSVCRAASTGPPRSYISALHNSYIMPLHREAFIHRITCQLIMLLLAWCVAPFGARAQYYPMPPVVPAGQLPVLLQQAHNATRSTQRNTALNALGSLYVNLPEKKTKDLALAQRYAWQAFNASRQSHDSAGTSQALLLLGQIHYWQNDLIDSIVHLMPLADRPTKMNLLLQLSFYYWYIEWGDQKANSSKCIAYAQQAIALSDSLGLQAPALMARRNIALAHEVLGQGDVPAELLQIVDAYKQIGYTKLYYCYFGLTWHYTEHREMDKAYYYAQEAVKAAVATKDTMAIGDAYQRRGLVHYLNDAYEQALRDCETAAKFYARQSGTYAITSLYTQDIRLATLQKLGRKEESLRYLLDFMKKYPPAGITDSILYLHRIAAAYRGLKRFPEAEHHLKLLYRLKVRNHSDVSGWDMEMGHLYVDAGQYEKARVHLYRSLAAPGRDPNSSNTRYLRYLIYLSDSATHRYLDAIKQLNIVNDQNSAAARLEKDKLVEKMQVAYKAKEKEAELQLKNQNIALLQRESIAQKDKLRQSQQITLLSAGGLALAVITGALLFFLYRQKQRSSVAMSEKNGQLQRLLSEKEWLLKEVHHRVKNNLHTIYCLLESQARMATPEARMALEKSQHRIYAMSLFHQKMYQSDNLEEVDFGTYIREFLLFLEDGFGLEEQHIRVTCDIAPVVLPLNLAMPLALVANEALTNAAKYAFKGRTAGEIRLTLQPDGQGYCLSIMDNGVGMAYPVNHIRRTLGMDLMHGLCADIGAELRITGNEGTTVSVLFEAA